MRSRAFRQMIAVIAGIGIVALTAAAFLGLNFAVFGGRIVIDPRGIFYAAISSLLMGVVGYAFFSPPRPR